MRKVSTRACCPWMQACDTPSVSTIQAENGANENRSCGGCWNCAVSFIQLWKRGMRGKPAALLLHRAEAGGAGTPAAREPGHPALEEVAHAPAVVAQDAPRAIEDRSRRPQARQLLRVGVVADVLPPQIRRETFPEEVLIVQ